MLIATTLFNASCSNETKMKEDTNTKEAQEENIETKVVDFGNFKYGTWKIDSIAENKVIIDRLVKDTIIQVMNFRKDGILSTMEVSNRFTAISVIGKWKVKDDSVFIITEQGKIALRYGFEFKDSTLSLNGKFKISSNNKKKPTLYLSKYVEPYNEKIYGPKKNNSKSK